jgi:iron(III) transport system permease protein
VTANSEISLPKVAGVNGPARLSGSVRRYVRLVDYPVVALSTLTIVIIGLLVLPPVWTLLRTSFANTMPDLSTSGFTLEHYANLVTGRNLAVSTINSIVFATCATALSLVIGGVLAWLVERTDAPMKGLAYVTTIVSLGTPYILYVTAWLFLLGRAGPFNDLYRTWIDPTSTPFNVNSLTGMILIEGFLWSPLVFLLLSSTFRAANADMEEAARMSGASILDTIRLISMKLARPALFALALFVFIRNIEAFEVPALGMPGRIDVLTTELYKSIKEVPPRVGYASAFSVVMLVIVGALLFLYGKISKQAERYASITGKGFRPRPFALGRGRWIAGFAILVNFTIVLALPISAILWTSLMPFVRPMRWVALGSATIRHYDAVISSPYYLGLALNTLMVSAGTATVVMLLALVAGWLAARRKPGAAVIDQLITMPLVFPGLVLGIALLEIGLRFPVPIYGTLWLIGLAFVIRYLPYGMRYAYSGVLQIHSELEQAASVSGANIRESLRFIIRPLLIPALASGWLFIFLIAAKEISLPLLLSGPSSQTISVAMFDLWANGQGGEVAALGLMWVTFMTVIATIFYRVARRLSLSSFGR